MELETNDCTCIICRKSYQSSKAKPEHILLSALGGKKKTRQATCSDCNSKAGQNIDKELAEVTTLIRNIHGWEGDNSGIPQLKNLKTADGSKLSLLPKGVPDLDNTQITKQELPDGKVLLKANVSGMDRLAALIPHLAKMAKTSEDKIIEQITKEGLKINVQRPPTIDQRFSFGGTNQIASSIKMGFVLWSELIGNSNAISDHYKDVSEDLHDIIWKGSEKFKRLTIHPPEGYPPTGLNLPDQELWGAHYNLIHVECDKKGKISTWFRLYNCVNFITEIATDERFKGSSITLVSNPETQKWAIFQNQISAQDKKWLDVNKPINYELMRESMGSLIGAGYKKMQERNQERVIDDSIFESIPVGAEVMEEEHIAELGNRIAQAIVAEKFNHNYEKMIPEDRAKKLLLDKMDKKKKK